MPVLPLVAIIGRANVGKSTLFNRLILKHKSIVNDTPGVTRDRIYEQSDWLGRFFTVVDTGGVDVDGVNEIEDQVVEQALLAQSEADAIIFVADKNMGLTPQDREVVDRIRKSGKPFFLAVNKVDHAKHELELSDFAGVGVDTVYPISAEHGHGVADMLDALVAVFPEEEDIPPVDDTVRVAVVGRPNVGKSSLVNRLLDSSRCIVSNIPGTTRDAVDTTLEVDGKSFLLVDTAGIRRKGKTREVLDKFSVIMALKALDRCDIAVIIVDGSEGITDQDATIAGYAFERGRGCILAVNKWDLVKPRGITIKEIEEQIKDKCKFLDFAPILVISALTGYDVDKILPQVESVCEEYRKNISTGRLNDCFERAIERNPISSYRGKFVKMHYTTQIKSRPPTFKCFVNYPDGIHFSYKRYLVNSLRKTFGLAGAPVRLIFSGKPKRNRQ
ncbi:MAG TPA: ribosome biogenesis GTPase Der [Nitrospinaceae bacterium]|nr:ribosome biogenesis GTPase Der [Nitrospinaceae bacterium]